MHVLFSNKKFNLNYFSIENIEAGISLTGAEVKSIIAANANIDQAFVVFKKNEAYLMNMYVAPYKQASKVSSLACDRSRKLLLHKNEIIKLQFRVKKERLTIIPVLVYLSKNNIKIQIALAKSKKAHDKREDIKKRDAQREIKRY